MLKEITISFKDYCRYKLAFDILYGYSDKVYVKQLRPYVRFHGGMGFKDEVVPLDKNIDWTNEKDVELDEWTKLFTSIYSGGWNTLEIHERYSLYEPVKTDSQ